MIMQVNQVSTASASASPPRPPSEQLEQLFLEEMLKYCGPKSNTGAFGGGIGEDQFSSFLIQEQATALAGRMDLGFSKWMGQ
jgi:flagellar protein FlgJ